MKVALIGCGRVSKKHIEAVRANPNLKLACVCDKDVPKLNHVCNEHNVRGYNTIEEMFDKEKIDIVSVLVEAGNHAQVVCEIAKYKKHIIVEKPIALKLDDADRMIEACDRNNIKLFVVKQNRFNLPVIQLKKAMNLGRFGKLVMGTVRLRWARDEAYFKQDSWRGTWRFDGGVFASQASHHVDMLRWLMGPVKNVHAISSNTIIEGLEVEDTGIATLEFENGALGLIEATNACRPKNLEGSVSILGRGGTVVIEGFAVNHLKTWEFAEPHPMDKEVWDSSENPPDVYGFGHARFYESVVENLKHAGGNIIDGMEGKKSLELICAIYESIATKKTVELRFHPEQLRLGK